MITSGIRPLPYYSTNVTLAERDLARSLRTDFIPKIARRLPGHHLRGFGHREIIDCVKRYKRNYPYFLRTDISRFYPSIRHRDLIVGVQLAWCDHFERSEASLIPSPGGGKDSPENINY